MAIRQMLFVVALCFAASSVHAQTPPTVTVTDTQSIAEITGAVAVHGAANENHQRPTVPGLGVALLPSIYPRDHVGIVGEWSIYTITTPTRTEKRRALLGGVKLRSALIGQQDRFNLFAQLLAGTQWRGGGPRRLALQAGVGADSYLPNGLVLHVAYDYRFTPIGGPNVSTGRYMVGLGIPIPSW
jgi:hypothetical protein